MRSFALTALALLIALPAAACRPPGASRTPSRADSNVVTDNRTAIPTLHVPRVDTAGAVLDGRLDEPFWHRAARTEGFVSPGDGTYDAASLVNGTALAAWTDDALWIALTVYDRDPASPNDRDAVDPHVWATASGIEVMLQPGDPDNNHNYYEIQVDVNGAIWDTRFDDYNRPITGEGDARRFGHQDWSAALERGVHIDPVAGSYTVEMRLPWSAYASRDTAIPPVPGDVWRVNLYTFRDGQRHARAWSPLLGEGNFHRSSRFGRFLFEADPS